jgi:uracil-DNA glycosylase
MVNKLDVGRILGTPVPMLVPADGPVHVLVIGEAPGPRGADKSGVPFFGDAAGRHLYSALERLGAITMPAQVADLEWDGARFTTAGLTPVAHGVALGNAYDRCPTDNGQAFRAPQRSELESPHNLARLQREVELLRSRGLRGVVTLGRVATRTFDTLFQRVPMPDLARRALPHPSAQGLLSMAPNRGKGAKMSELQDVWMVQCQLAIVQAGFPAPAEAE